MASVDMPVNLPEGWVYDKVFGPQAPAQHAMKAAGRAANYDPSVGGLQNSLMPSVLPQFAFDGGADAAQEAAPAPVDAAPAAPDQADLPDASSVVPDSSTVVATGSDASQANRTYPVLPLTVVPKQESSPLASLKAPDTDQRIAILALVLAFLSAVTFMFWRYHRRDYASPRRIGRRI